MQKLCVDRARGPRSGPLFTFMYTDMSATIWNTNWGCLGTSNVVHLPFSDAMLRYCYGERRRKYVFLICCLDRALSQLLWFIESWLALLLICNKCDWVVNKSFRGTFSAADTATWMENQQTAKWWWIAFEKRVVRAKRRYLTSGCGKGIGIGKISGCSREFVYVFNEGSLR